MASTQDFVPFYKREEMRKLIRLALEGSLDGISSSNKVVPGIHGCEVGAWGIQPQSLLTRFTVEDVVTAIRNAATDDSGRTAMLTVMLEYRYPLETIARAMNLESVYAAQDLLSAGYDRFARHLLV